MGYVSFREGNHGFSKVSHMFKTPTGFPQDPDHRKKTTKLSFHTKEKSLEVVNARCESWKNRRSQGGGEEYLIPDFLFQLFILKDWIFWLDWIWNMEYVSHSKKSWSWSEKMHVIFEASKLNVRSKQKLVGTKMMTSWWLNQPIWIILVKLDHVFQG